MGESELEVSEVGFGLWTLSAPWWKPPADDQAVALLKEAYGQGINFYCASSAYGGGKGESLLADAFGDMRENVILATSVAVTRGDEAEVRAAVDASLGRLRSDYIDMLYVHHPSMAAMKNDALFAALDAVRDEGKIRYWGLNFGPAVGYFEEGMAAIKKRFASCIQHSFSLLEQDPGRRFFTASLEGNSGNVLRDIHASGPLAGAYDPATTFTDAEAEKVRPPSFLTWAEAAAKQVAWIHEGRGMTLAQAVVKFCLAEETVHSVLPNIQNSEALTEFAAAPDNEDYSQQEVAQLAELYRKSFNVPRPG